jgi:hypothetical protein
VRGRAATAPFAGEGAADDGGCHVVCAADRRGGIAVACYEIARDGLVIEDLGVVAPPRARPVMRGKRRTDPGTPLPCPSPAALVDVEDQGRFDVAAGVAGDGVEARVAELAEAIASGAGLEQALRDRAPSAGVVQAGRGARAYSFTP